MKMQLFNRNYFMKSQTRNDQIYFALVIRIAYLPAKRFQRNFVRLSIMLNCNGQWPHGRDVIGYIELSIPVQTGGVHHVDFQLAALTIFTLLQKVTP